MGALPKFFMVLAALSSVDGSTNLRSALKTLAGPTMTREVVEALEAAASEAPKGRFSKSRLSSLEEKLRPLFDAMPKVNKDRLDHATVRYVLHRFFMQKHSWFVRGLEPGDDAASALDAVVTSNFTLDSNPVWPSFLQADLERLVGAENGLTLHHVASLAASLEELVWFETVNRLTMAYDGVHMGTETLLDEEGVFKALKEYMLLYTSGWNMTEMSHEELEMEERKHYGSNRWRNSFVPWLQQLQEQVSVEEGLPTASVDFAAVTKIAEEVGRNFYELNNLDCQSMKSALMEMEDRKPGRVRLSDFYNKSRVTKWAFTEKVDYLRTLGALDETNASNPLVIYSNYIMSMPQCLKSSSLYTVCCPNECEPILSSLEREVGALQADPDVIAEIVRGMSTDTVDAPRELSETLMQRLREISALHGGRVPLHGRLFAQWLHHAFPRECPFPHQASATSPLTPDEWIKETGNADSQATEEEMLKHIVPDDTCPVTGCPKGEDEDGLPWNPLEELLQSTQQYSGIVNGESEMKLLLEEVDEVGQEVGSSVGSIMSTLFSATTVAGLLAAAVACVRFYGRCSGDAALQKQLKVSMGCADAFV